MKKVEITSKRFMAFLVVTFLLGIAVYKDCAAQYFAQDLPENFTTVGEMMAKKANIYSYEDRKAYFESKGLKGYVGSAEQNTLGSKYYDYCLTMQVTSLINNQKGKEVVVITTTELDEDKDEDDWITNDKLLQLQSENSEYKKALKASIVKIDSLKDEIDRIKKEKQVKTSGSNDIWGFVLLFLAIVGFSYLLFQKTFSKIYPGDSFIKVKQNRKSKRANKPKKGGDQKASDIIKSEEKLKEEPEKVPEKSIAEQTEENLDKLRKTRESLQEEKKKTEVDPPRKKQNTPKKENTPKKVEGLEITNPEDVDFSHDDKEDEEVNIV